MKLLSGHYLDQQFASGGRPLGDDAILRLLPYLSNEDRILMELCFRAHLPRQEVARLLKVQAGTVTRRIQRLQRRLGNPLVKALLDLACPLPREQRQIVLDYLLQGLSFKELTDRHQVSHYAVRETISYARGWFIGIRMAPRGAGREEEQ